MQRLIDSFVASPIALVGTGRDAIDAAIITAVAGPVIVLVLRAVVLALTDKVDRQRDLYSKAFRAALAWKEMLYRVRRRTPGSERDLIERFHELQEEIDYFEGWTASEGRSIGRSYCRLVREIKRQTQPLIREAWSNSPRPTAEPAPEDEIHPDVNAVCERFLKDVRAQLSLWGLPRIAVWWRNRGPRNTDEEQRGE